MMSTALVPTANTDALTAAVLPLVLDTLPSEHSKRAYARAISEYTGWWSQDRRPFCRATIQAYKAHLEESGKSSASINQALTAIKGLAREARYKGLIDSETESGIRDIRGPKQLGRRTGNWLVLEDAQRLIEAPDNSLQGLRDRALIGLLLGCGLRRAEACAVEVGQIQVREGRGCIVDLCGKGKRLRTVPIPVWAYRAIREWIDAAGITDGVVLRGFDPNGHMRGRMSENGVRWVVTEHARRLGLEFAPHDLRRSAAKLAREGGAKLEQIQRCLGHATVTTTEIYTHAGLEFRQGKAAFDFTGLGR